jgi:hypothetical protein
MTRSIRNIGRKYFTGRIDCMDWPNATDQIIAKLRRAELELG